MVQPNLLELIQPETVVARRDDVVVRAEGNGLAIMLAEAGVIIQVDEIGRIIWQSLITPKPIAAIIAHLLDLYDVEQTVCERQTLTLMRRWLVAEIITSDAYQPVTQEPKLDTPTSFWQQTKTRVQTWLFSRE